MKRLATTLAASLAALAVNAGSAFASGPPVQSGTQSSSTGQGAIAASSATQVDPSNQNLSVRVLSPGDNGAVTQSNTASSSSNAANTAGTTQNATQTQGASGCGCQLSPLQQILQGASTGQPGEVMSGAQQLAGSNTAAPASAGPSGSGDPTSQSNAATPSTAAPSTSQSNGAASTGSAANTAPTAQGASQTQGGGGTQSTDQTASTDQGAQAASSVQQDHPSNSNISVRVLSPGNDGSTSQSNTASSTASASNNAATTQNAPQAQSGGGSGVQSSTQDAQTEQVAKAASSAQQDNPSNSNISVRVLSPGGDGNVTQSNTDSSTATATNNAPATQTGSQNQTGASCGCSGTSPAVQAIGQQSRIDQFSGAASSADQTGATNSNNPVRIGSKGDGGNVTQSNTDSSTASATNAAPVSQTGTQMQNGGSGVQAITQDAQTDQAAKAESSAQQDNPSNSNDSVRVLSPGNDGSVTQSNTVSSTGSATNTAPVTQTGSQSQSSPSCGCSGSGPAVQAIGQESKVDQLAGAESSAQQVGAANKADPVRIWSDGGGGTVTQSNADSSTASASNTAPVSQTGTQVQAGSSCGCSGGPAVQALGQDSWTGQLSGAASSAQQVGATNKADPVRIWSDGNDGNLTQSNAASSTATAANGATTTQQGNQSQSGSGVQAVAQKAGTLQAGFALSSAAQIPGRETCGCEGSSGSFGNSARPIRIASDGNDGSVTQSNMVSSTGSATNQAATTQGAGQTQGSSCGCSGLGVQALGQEAFTYQLAKALSSAWQIGAKNAFDPVRVWSDGGGGTTSQTNGASSQASSPNLAGSGQNASQAQIGAPIKI